MTCPHLGSHSSGYNTSVMLANRLVLAESAWYKVDNKINLPPCVTNKNINGHR